MRTSNSFKNLITSAFGRLLSIALGFAVRTVFLATLSEEYAGINGLLTSVLVMLTMTELGIGAAITYSMYKPVAEGDTEKTRSLLRLYRNAYRIIGIVAFVIGMAIVPFLHVFVKGSTDLVDLRIVFILYLLEMCSSYWMSYYSSVLFTEQKDYVLSLISYVSSLISTVVKIVLLLALRRTPMLSFYCYAGTGFLTNMFNNFLIRWKVRRTFPWTRDLRAEPLPKEEKKSIYKNVVGMLFNKIATALNDGIDNMVVSAFIGLATVGVYSNYLMIKQYVSRFLSTLFGSVTASIGNICAIESQEKKESFFRSLQFTYFWIYGFCAICFWTLFNSFIVGVWLHDTKWLLSDVDVFLVVFNFLIQGLVGAVVKYRDVNGLFWQTKFRYIFSSVFNAGFSVVLVGPCHMGITGALLGTTASIIILISYDPVLVYREVFHKKAGEYYRTYFLQLLLIMATGAVVHLLALPFRGYTVGNFAVRMVLCLAIPNGLWYLLYRKDPRFVYLRNTVTGFGRKLLHKLRKKSRPSGEEQIQEEK